MGSVHDEILYEGETKARSARVIMALALLCPGLAYAYIGRLMRGILVNALFVLLALGFVLAQIVWLFFPLLPGLVFALGWFVLAWCVGKDAQALAAQDADTPYLLKPYNHALPYAAIGLLSFALPVGAALGGGLSRVWDVHEVKHWGMYPSLVPGDVLLIHRSGFHNQLPQRGDLVAVSSPKPGAPTHVLRVVAAHKDNVRIEGDMFYLNKTALDQTPVTLEVPAPEGADVLTLAEHNASRAYPISVVRKSVSNVSVKESTIKRDQMFLMSDNRSKVSLGGPSRKIRDSRDFGPLRHDTLRGKPLFILWSLGAESSPANTDRVGLRLSP